MRIKFIKLTFCLLFCNVLFAQTEIDGFEFEFKKVKEITTKWEVHSSPYVIFIDYDVNKKAQVRFRVKSSSKKRAEFNPNKFYLVVEGQKIKLRPIDLKHNYMLHNYIGFGYVTPNNKDNYPEAKDVFFDYDIEGFTNIENKLDFGTKRKPRVEAIYFDSKMLRTNIVDVYFCVPKSLKKASIYFGNTKLKDLIFKKF